MDGYQALPEDKDTEEIANQLMSNLNIPSEDSALVPLIVDGDINTDDKILSMFVRLFHNTCCCCCCCLLYNTSKFI